MRTQENVTEEMTLESPHHFYKEFSWAKFVYSFFNWLRDQRGAYLRVVQ